jgi:hypothetical protein
MAKDIWIFLRGVRFKRTQENYLVSEDEWQVIFNGYFYRWDGNYYRKARTTFNSASTLQRAVWVAVYGEIPDGFTIHHKDENTKNNELDNLLCLKNEEHLSLHANMQGSWPKSEACKQLL